MLWLHLTLFQAWFTISFIVGLPQIQAVSFTSEEQQAILDKHNEYRSQVNPVAADMKFMTWDDSLATMAQQYAELCIWDHGQVDENISPFDPIGQNLWITGGNPQTVPAGTSSTYAWYNEVNNFIFSSNTCNGVCGHYTQVVWADTYALGCGRTFCETAPEPSVPNSNPKTNIWLVVCNYGPAGNYKRQPYVEGPVCSNCSSGIGQCYNNLCRLCSDHNEECVCKHQCHGNGDFIEESCSCSRCYPGFEGHDCSSICEDRSKYCNNGWYLAQCSWYKPASSQCPLMCGSCDK